MKSRALILFAKLPRPGNVKTRLGADLGMDKAAEVYRILAEHAFTLADTAMSNGVKVYLFFVPDASESEMRNWVGRDFVYCPQQGVTLGDRMKHAFSRTFDDGSNTTAILGTDVPDLTTDVLFSSYELLSKVDIVLGPSTDGGYYLLGMNRPVKSVFDGIEWSTDRVFLQTLQLLKQQRLSFDVLPEFSDIDTKEDYEKYLARFRPTRTT